MKYSQIIISSSENLHPSNSLQLFKIFKIWTDYYATIWRNEITKQSEFVVTLCIEGPVETINEYLFDCFHFELLPRRQTKDEKKNNSFDQECLTLNNSRLNRTLIVCSIWEEAATSKPFVVIVLIVVKWNFRFDLKWTHWTSTSTLVLCISHLHANPNHYYVFFYSIRNVNHSASLVRTPRNLILLN